MIVDMKDGRCVECSHSVRIIDADDATMTVECTNPECCAEYKVETDAFNDGGIHYYPLFVTGQMVERRREEHEGD